MRRPLIRVGYQERAIAPVIRINMQRVNEHRFYELGIKVHPLTEITNDDLVKHKFFVMWDARGALFEIFSDMPFRVCLPAANEVVYAIDAILHRDINQASDSLGDDSKLLFRGSRIREAASKFETILGAELQSLDTYLVSQKGSYSTPDLIERAEIIFPESIRNHLPNGAINDIRQAGRCLALDTATACGFHILRAVESVMAAYYELVTSKPMPTRMRNWGIYIKKLREFNASPKVVQLLDHIREEYRNPITHPEVILEIDEVEVLLGVAAGAIRQIVIESLRIKIERATAQSPTAAIAVP